MGLPLQDKVAFITGASRGIGQACAVALAQAGAHCIISARTQMGLMQTDDIILSFGGKATLLPLDLGNSDASQQIDLIGPSIAAQFNRLDIFIHAAFQYVPLTPVTQITDRAWDKNIQANLSSAWRLIRTLSPLLTATADANAIFFQPITSVQPFWSPVVSIQAALGAMIQTWQQEIAQLSSLNIHYLSLPPTNTLLRQSFFPAENKLKLNTPVQTANDIIALITH
ncbi:NADP-dependent 3-hydroxy acid dehydrogenase YdfG (YdfG) (PDB:3P19) [Commensalibacter communis]|uniref:SDR family NAD(P)-dependent oxidoreductase n=1 Tax=Commensalibacter communis TaxID=2972786 RepID=UPI0022FF60FE|nr:SDR family NAD(P)-dependent oxidoreductase [Commensalibacter communis]CAI3951171.1 NADP-dependent 3-hydroxy acid dehydrogenase YdfG (YdfG) (PDB:3P19) [Commensalibacter communis]CAI3953216.1 NADP-dependent 3-hydroxy acid dehydrogenase YdfG (YdfG) (PDB:3P19) [Commensalibacter communis]